MSRLKFAALFSVFIAQNASAGINLEQSILVHNQKINTLIQTNKILKGEIESLVQQQKITTGKINELFNLLNYKQASRTQKTAEKSVKSKQKSSQIYVDARSFLGTDQYDRAAQLFKQYLKTGEEKHAADARYWLAKTYLALENYPQARDAFLLFQQQNPRHHKFANSLLELAKTYRALKQSTPAIKVLQTLLKKFPKHQSSYQARQLLSELRKKRQ